MAEEPNVGGASSRDELPFKRVSFDSEAARKRKPKSLKQIMEQMGTRYGADTSYQTFNWASVLAAPSVRPRHKYCDITGLLAPYVDPKTGLRYHNAAVYQYIKTLSPEAVQRFLKLRNAHTIVK